MHRDHWSNLSLFSLRVSILVVNPYGKSRWVDLHGLCEIGLAREELLGIMFVTRSLSERFVTELNIFYTSFSQLTRERRPILPFGTKLRLKILDCDWMQHQHGVQNVVQQRGNSRLEAFNQFDILFEVGYISGYARRVNTCSFNATGGHDSCVSYVITSRCFTLIVHIISIELVNVTSCYFSTGSGSW